MPVGINSPARNLFLLGSSGQAAVTNFFETIDQSAGTDGVYLPAEIKYIFSSQKYALAGSAQDSNAVSFGWFERQDYDIETGLLTTDYTNEVVNTQSLPTTLFAMELDANENLIVGGKTGDVPWIAKYSNDGVLDWQSTTNSADVEYSGIASNSSGNYYACGSTQSSDPQQAFVEKFDANGNPGWGKSAFMLGRHVMLDAIDANSRGQVVAVGHLEDDSYIKGYIVKIDTNTGEVLWDRTLDAGNDITLGDVFIDSNDQIYIVGTSLTGAVEGYIFKYTAEGNLIWQRKTNGSSLDSFTFDRVKSDGETEQTIVFGTYYDQNGNDLGGVLSKYAKDGSLVWRRTIFSSNNNSDSFSDVCLDADPSFYYLLYVDTEIDGLAGTPDSYTFGKVSSSGNGLGGFQYADGTGETIDYQILNIGDTISRVSDGAVRNDSSDLITYPFTGNKIVFDDLSTQVTNKKRQMDTADSFEYSGSPAIRPADFQELNLLGDVYSGSGNWLDQSGKGNDAVVEFTTTTTTGGTTESENFRTVTSSYSTYGTVTENTVTNDLPYNNADWSHYGGKVRDLQTGGFRIDLTGNSNGGDFFMACWIKFDTYAVSRQMGIDLFGGYVYWETLANGAIAVRHNGGNRADSSATNLNDGNWHHIALSRTGGTLYGMLDGASVVSTTSGVSGASVNSNENFWFFGGSGTAYNTDAKILDPIVAIGTGVSGYTVPTEPVIDANGTFPNASPHVPFFSNNWAYISPAVSLGGTTTTTTNGPTYNSSGYWEFDGVDDNVFVNDPQQKLQFVDTGSDFAIECWVRRTAAGSGSFETMLSTWGQGSGIDGWIVAHDAGSLHFTWAPHSQGTTFITGGTLNLNTWYHIMVTKNGSAFTMYLDGVSVATGTNPGTINTSYDKLEIGHYGNNDASWFTGHIGEVRIYPRGLTAAAVFQNYNASKSKYINEAPDTAPKIGPGIVYDNNLLLNYDFGNRATYDPAQNDIRDSTKFTAFNVVNTVKTLNAAKAPDGTMTAVKIERGSTGSSTWYLDYVSTIPANNAGTYTYSVWMRGPDGFTGGARIALLEQTGGNTEVSVNITDQWQQYSVTKTYDGTFSTNIRVHPVIFRNQPGATDAGKVVPEFIYMWQPQLEKASTTGRHVPTYTSRGSITAPTTVKNLSGTSIDGTINLAPFNSGGWFEFDGGPDSGTRIAFDSSTIDLSGSFSIDMWFRQGAQTADYWMLLGAQGYGDPGSNGIGHYLFADTIRTWAQDTTGTNTTVNLWDSDGTVNFTANVWYNLILTREVGTAWRWYLNGSLVNSNTTTFLSVDFTTPNTYIGDHYNDTSWQYDGDIAALRMYSKALTAAEALQNFNATRGKYGV
jgi:hypothetical protein